MNWNHLQKYPSLCHLNFYRVTKLSRLYHTTPHLYDNTPKLQPCLQHLEKTLDMNSSLLFFPCIPSEHSLLNTPPALAPLAEMEALQLTCLLCEVLCLSESYLQVRHTPSKLPFLTVLKNSETTQHSRMLFRKTKQTLQKRSSE